MMCNVQQVQWHTCTVSVIDGQGLLTFVSVLYGQRITPSSICNIPLLVQETLLHKDILMSQVLLLYKHKCICSLSFQSVWCWCSYRYAVDTELSLHINQDWYDTHTHTVKQSL